MDKSNTAGEKRTVSVKDIVCLLAYPAKHSLSPLIHNTAFEKTALPFFYTAFDVPPNSLQNAILGVRALGIKGAGVSMPHKQNIIRYLDEISDTSELTGAVNTVNHLDGRLIGHNTDGLGYVGALRSRGVEIKGAKLVVAGSGGAGKAIIAQAALSGAKEIAVFNRRESPNFSEAVELATRLKGCLHTKIAVCDIGDKQRFYGEISSADVFTNATSVGMKPNENSSVIAERSVFHKGLIVFDSVYNPIRTKLLEMAESAGCVTVNGVEMLLYQGAEQFQIWTELSFPMDFVKSRIYPLLEGGR
ncbi:MAG: shikimate dehydrogenase [Deferribacteraceae bacterium]|jgi:quinate/shikimate dehydrogenase|nr:shikimate dehydrogenase [Deferribacteraceae bacterium]